MHTTGISDPLVVLTADLAPVIEAWLVREWREAGGYDAVTFSEINGHRVAVLDRSTRSCNTNGIFIGYLEWLEEVTGLNQRTIWRIRTRESVYTILSNADKILTAIGAAPECYTDGRLTIVPNPRWSQEKWQAWFSTEAGSCEERVFDESGAG